MSTNIYLFLIFTNFLLFGGGFLLGMYVSQKQVRKTCANCTHKAHEAGACSFLHIYARGPGDPPGNQRCMCGVKLRMESTNGDTHISLVRQGQWVD